MLEHIQTTPKAKHDPPLNRCHRCKSVLSLQFAPIRTPSPASLTIVSMTQVKAVLFDYGMVLSAPPDPAAWQRMIAITAPPQDLLHREYWAPPPPYDPAPPAAGRPPPRTKPRARAAGPALA